MNRQMRHQSLPSQPWLQRCRDAPVEAARALLECFRSFTDSGYLMGDLHGAQFTLNDAGEVFAIDAPEPRPGAPVAATLDWALEGAAQKAHGLGGLGMNCSRDGSTGGRGDCPMTSDVERCALGDCIRGFEAGARETRGWCRRSWCVGVDARAHVFNLATRTWALPLILQEGRFPSPAAKRRLEELAKRMRSEAPEDRPSLADALAALDAAPASSVAVDPTATVKQELPWSHYIEDLLKDLTPFLSFRKNAIKKRLCLETRKSALSLMDKLNIDSSRAQQIIMEGLLEARVQQTLVKGWV